MGNHRAGWQGHGHHTKVSSPYMGDLSKNTAALLELSEETFLNKVSMTDLDFLCHFKLSRVFFYINSLLIFKFWI